MSETTRIIEKIRQQKALWQARQAQLDQMSAVQMELSREVIRKTRQLIERVDAILIDDRRKSHDGR